MAYLGKGKKEDLRILCDELGLTASEELKMIDLRNLIIKHADYDEEYTKELFSTIIETRKAEQERKIEIENLERERKFELENREREHNFELEKLRLTPSTPASNTEVESGRYTHEKPRIDLQKLIPRFRPNEDDMNIFLVLCERQLKVLGIPEENWVTYLISALPSDIAKLIAREPEEKAQDYQHIKAMLLKRFKLTAEKFRTLFVQHKKVPESTWKDFFFEIRTYLEGWLAELNITTFEDLKNLMLSDKLKRKCSQQHREHFLDGWADLNEPYQLVEKLDAYDALRVNPVKTKEVENPRGKKNWSKPKETIPSSFSNQTSQNKSYPQKKTTQCDSGKVNPLPHFENRPTLKCYGCGAPGFIRAKCPTCNPAIKSESTDFDQIQIYSCSTTTSPLTTVNLYVNGVYGKACIDTGSSHSLASESLYSSLQKHGVRFQAASLNVTLANGQQSKENCLTTTVTVEIQGRKFGTNFIVIPNAKGNRTLLGRDFLDKSGFVPDVKNKRWYFSDMPHIKYRFADSVPKPLEFSADAPVLNSCSLRANEGKDLMLTQKSQLNQLLKKYETIFQPGGEATPFMEHHINTGNHPPVSVPPYRMTPAKKEILKAELDDLLQKGIIEECESPYAAPVVLIPKPDGTVRLCIDYRKLNAITKLDSYPLPRIDDLLHEAKHTAFMSTIDLKSGYHQVNVHPPDRDKTAFTCPFGTFRYLRMPFGLTNAPATFQRLIDRFRRGLPEILMLSYLDDIIVLSETFEKHLADLTAVFERLLEFKLRANREKCKFVCSRAKYLGHWITKSGIEVDPDKTAAIQKMPAPRTVKQVQSFLQSCSWYRRFIQNFSDIARPLSNLTKKNSSWKWGKEEQTAFETLKQLLTSPPVLKQNDATKPYILRTDASGYALGAVLLQGCKEEEHPIEYASRLLNAAERNYSTTEREALAVVWALNKFRGYIEGHEVTIASDHQPLKWLMSLKSPSGRLARWALQIQPYNLKIEYIPGKTNVVADMLSRPNCSHEEPSCEVCTVSFEMPKRSPMTIRQEQLKDDDLRKIIETFESRETGTEYANWTERGYLLNQGVLYRYAPDSESEEAQLVVPAHERNEILKSHHDAPTAGHYGAEGTYHRISKRYYWTGMRTFITNYVKNCADCLRYKASNTKPAGLLQTPIYCQRFETIAIDLFGPLPETKNGKKWILIVEDCSTKWVELFALNIATAKECAVTLLEEVFLRYGLPRRIISDNGSQFVSAVMQQLCYLLDVKHTLTPVYHPQANPVERKNRDLKPRLAILVGNEHSSWAEKLPTIRFAMNTAKCDTTGQTAAFLQFGREPRTLDDIRHDIRPVIDNDNFVPEITPYLKNFANFTKQVKDLVEQRQDKRKQYADKRRREGPRYSPGDHVWVELHPVSKAGQKRTTKFSPRRDGPYVVLTQHSPTSYEVASLEAPEVPLGTYHVSALKYCNNVAEQPVVPLRKRGRPKKPDAGPLPRRLRNQRGRM